MGKGSNRERELVDMFYDEKWGVMRAPGSGGGTEREQPDIIAGHDEKDIYIAIEAKSKRSDYAYVGEQEVEDLREFCNRFGVDKCLLGFRFNRTSWYFFKPDELSRTPQGKYSMSKKDVEEGRTFEDIIEKRNEDQ